MNYCYDMPIGDTKKKHLTDLLPGTVIIPRVPTYKDNLLVNDRNLGEEDGWDDGVTGLSAEISDDRTQFTFARTDSAPIQILNVHEEKFGRVFADPVESVQINKLDDGSWAADVDPENILNKPGLVCFVEVIAQVALIKQKKLQSTSS